MDLDEEKKLEHEIEQVIEDIQRILPEFTAELAAEYTNIQPANEDDLCLITTLLKDKGEEYYVIHVTPP
ncbi:hypothetical protein NPIL_629521 [Nephila pilipes]|uniref:Uncharacterized protein n=1 Tax=Nephila pilipes TaxID=299642 RepID=A0A8X6QHZ2_NEPPI|nr:hypothetical protein NPIL_629521 [Nephila pilipes]